MQILQLDEFLRSIKQNIDTPHSLLLGAGASIESGIPSAADCIWYWKREIYLSQNPGAIGNFDNSKSEAVRRVIQRWIDSQNIYPAENSAEEYSYFAEKAYPIADDRRKYFQHLVSNHDPSLGYHLISLLALENIIKSVWTTNFDGMTLKCAHQYSPLVPIEITAETSGRIYRGDVDKELLCIALHGDYKYGVLKNTEKELDSQDGELVKALLNELTNRDLIVMGYSGRDQSLMNALQQVYSTKGSGKLFWCGYGTRVSSEVKAFGYSVMNGPSGSNVVVGCSHIYSSDGRGMKYKLSKIQDYSFDRKKNPYLSEEEAYRIGLNIKELFYKSFSELPKRVVIHKRTPFRREEVKGLVESLSSAGVKNIELLEITYEDNLKCFALNERCTQVDGYPVRRGMCFPIDKNTMYLFTHGIAPSVISPKRRYFQGGKSVPLPLKVVKHYGSGDMAQIATEILGLSKMNWNSFGLYSKLPCTIESSNEIARIGWLLSQFEGTLYDYRYFM